MIFLAAHTHKTTLMHLPRPLPLLAAVLCFAPGCALFKYEPGADIENVILLSVDALNHGVLPSYNAEAEPLLQLDRFAQRAVIFRNAFSSASWTLPAHASLVTGLYPDRHGVVRPGKRLANGQETLGQLFHDRGSETVAFTGGGFLSGSFGFGMGFDRYDGWTAERGWRSDLRLHQAGSEDGQLFDRAIAYLRHVGTQRRRFFLFLHTYFVHDYYKVDENEALKTCVLGQKPCTEAIWDDLRTRYRDRLVRFDEGFGRLLTALDQAGLEESTLVLLVSDHGEAFEPEISRIHHGGRLHDDVIRIPLLVAGPHLSHRLVDESVSLVDIAPTLTELFELPAEGGWDGVSFANSLYRGSDVEGYSRPRTLYAMEHAYRWVGGARVDFRAPEDGPPSYAVIHRNLYYIQENGREEIYDMRSDPDQRQNLAAAAFDPSPFRSAVESRARFDGGGEWMQMDRELEDRLRSLGYIQ